MLADQTWPLLRDGPRMSEHHGLEGLCDVNPLNPGVEEPETDLAVLRERYRVWSIPDGDGLPPIMMRISDTVFARARAVLCRFEPEFAAEIHRALARAAPSIVGASPLVLSHSLVHDTAILGAAEVDVLARWLDGLHRSPDLPLKETDVSGSLLTAILPHMCAERQFEVHQMQRRNARDAFWLGRMLERLPDHVIAEHLEAAVTSGEETCLRLALFFAAETGAGLDVVRPAITSALGSGDPRTRSAALRSMVKLGDVDGIEALAASGWAWSRTTGQSKQLEDSCGSVALLRARGGSDDPTLINRLHPALWSRAAERGGPRILAKVADLTAAAVCEVPLEALAPDGMDVTVIRWDGGPARDDLGSDEHSIGLSLDDEATLPGAARRKRLDMGDFHALLQRLTDLNRDALLYPMTSLAVDRLMDVAPSAFAALSSVVEAAIGGGPDQILARAAATLAFDVARSMSEQDPDRATALFGRAEGVLPLYPEEMPISHLPRSTSLLWKAADVPGIVAQRRRRLNGATNDEVLAFEVLAAELAGKRAEIVAYVTECLTGRHPARIARAVTVAGFACADPALEAVFDDARLEHGFLADVRCAAKKSYVEARWAEHWFSEARDATTELDVWRFGELALSSADARSVLWLEMGRGNRIFEMLRPLSRTTLEVVVARKRRHRRGRLFGEQAPPMIYLSTTATGGT